MNTVRTNRFPAAPMAIGALVTALALSLGGGVAAAESLNGGFDLIAPEPTPAKTLPVGSITQSKAPQATQMVPNSQRGRYGNWHNSETVDTDSSAGASRH